MSRATGPLMEDPRWTPEMKEAWEKLTADLPKMWDDMFDLARRANVSRYCDYGEHDACDEYGGGEVRMGLRCMCEHHGTN